RALPEPVHVEQRRDLRQLHAQHVLRRREPGEQPVGQLHGLVLPVRPVQPGHRQPGVAVVRGQVVSSHRPAPAPDNGGDGDDRRWPMTCPEPPRTTPRTAGAPREPSPGAIRSWAWPPPCWRPTVASSTGAPPPRRCSATPPPRPRATTPWTCWAPNSAVPTSW